MEDQRRIPLTEINRPRIALRALRRNQPEYVELVGSVQKDGVLQPILVRPGYCMGCTGKTCVGAGCGRRLNAPKGFKYDIVEGWHRFEASKETGKDAVPAYVKELTDFEVLIYQLKCNTIRPKTAKFEFARRLKLLMEQGYTLPELAALIDKSPHWIRDQLHLNRLKPELRPIVEQGEVAMKSALALANLPEDLQDKFVQDAVEMKANDFAERANHALRDFKEYLLRVQEEDRKCGAVRPTLRALNVIKRESIDLKKAKEVLKAAEAETALDGWRACLAWIFKLDPISVENRKAGRREKLDEIAATQAEFRRLNREMIRKYVNPTSETGDYKHGE
jgi:ParB family chromosome partitioning protein